MITIGARIKQLRLSLNLSQRALAKKLNVNRVALTHWENGDRIPSGKSVFSLADVFNVTPDFIVYGENVGNVKSINYLRGRIPVMRLNNIKDFLNDEFKPIDFVKTQLGEEKNKFCIIVEGDSMVSQSYPTFPSGSQIIIDKDREPKINDYVVAKILDIEVFVFRKLIFNVDKKFLQPLNSIYHAI